MRVLKRLGIAGTLAFVAGSSFVGLALYRDAVSQVETRIEQGVWTLPGRVWSGPVEVWPGLALSPEELATDLSGAGLARTSRLEGPGDFVVNDDAVMVWNRATEGRGWTIREGEVLVTFRSGRVASTSPTDPVRFPPTELASIRGADNETRRPRELEDFPEHLRDAVLAMEDAHFYEHQGISPFGIVRALLVNAIEGETVQGGSTLTQQLAKNLFLSQERTLSRKSQELLLAFALERELTKDEILALYLNEIYWGQVGGVAICGADEAARVTFGKPVERLTLSESATLAGIISSPNSYSPLRHPEQARARRDLALKRMVLEGFLDSEAAEAAAAEPLGVHAGPTGRKAPFVVDAAVDHVEAALGQGVVAERSLDIYTEINPPLQRHAERMVALSMAKLDAAFPDAAGAQVALVAVRVEDGAIVAMVGGRDYAQSQYNRALRARRQPGSTVKPLTMLAAFEEDRTLSPASVLLDEPYEKTLDGTTWAPTNYDGEFVGEITLRRAIAESRNIPAVLLAEQVGWADLARFYEHLGLSGTTTLPSASLGAFDAAPAELAGAYTVFPGQGRYAEPRLVRAVLDEEGSLLINDEPIVIRQASARATTLATSVLETVIDSGTGTRATTFGATGAVAGKTGTTDGTRDAWFVGFTPELSVAVWVGFDQGRGVGLSGATAAIPTWARFVDGSGTSDGDFPVSDEVVEAESCVGGFEDWECQECALELYTRGTEPANGCAPPLVSDLLELLPWRIDLADEEKVDDLVDKKRRRRRRLLPF
ncbi:MAG TPA: PBP1A family penicillin-binding protein [Myxococcota bacterium]|nr:PBP1A family penicillin-binding protein [Myxococcota bacterium]